MSGASVTDMNWSSALIVAGIGVIAVVVGGLLTMLCFRVVDRGQQLTQHHATGEDESGEPDDAEEPDDEHSVQAAASTLRGGAWIGALERLAIYSGLLIGWPEAIAIVLAVKGLGRYPELKNGENSAVAERFIIGTFVSVLWACGCAGLTHWLIN